MHLSNCEMASLKSGVLAKLLQEMYEENGSTEDRKPVLVQVRSIIPILEKGDLWPNGGFYLKVSDLSHALYVSLAPEENEMILGNQVKLGQYIYAHKLEKSHPLPTLSEITPIPGRRPCDGCPKDLISVGELANFFESSDAELIEEKGVISEGKIFEGLIEGSKQFHGLSDSETLMKKDESMGKCGGGHCRSFLDNDSDSDCTTSSASSIQVTKRRSWNESEILRVKEMFDSSFVKREIRSAQRCRSANVSPLRFTRYHSSDDNSSYATRRRVGGSKKLARGTNKNEIPVPKVHSIIAGSPPKDVNRTVAVSSWDSKHVQGIDKGVSWDSLPPSLARLGKDTVKHRDLAVLAAGEALQEACAAERLIKCLSIFSEFLQAEGDKLHQPSADEFFNLQDNLAQTRLILKSLTDITPLRTPGMDPSATIGSIKEALNIAVERKKNASSWIKSAVSADLSPPLDSLQHLPSSDYTTNLKKPGKESPLVKPRGASTARKQRNNCDIPVLLESEKDVRTEWMRGSTLCTAAELASSLQDECGKLFLGYVEKYLEEIENQTSIETDGSVVTALMCKVKRVNDWLDVIVKKDQTSCKKDEENRNGLGKLGESQMEACRRVKDRIYGILLNNVERTARVFGSMSISS